MTQNNTRRAFLQGIGGVSVIGLPTRADAKASTSADDASLTATDLVIPESEVPPGFEPYPTPDTSPFSDALDESALDVASTEIAMKGYWNGTTQSDPEWVLSTSALVADNPLPRAPIEAAAQQSYDEYVTAYNTETSPLIDFEQSHTRAGQISDWHVDIIERRPFEDSNDAARHIFTDHMRHQFLGNVVLGTIAFGPTDTDPPIDSLLAEYATMQRTRYETHGAMP
ncbi:hypothetical protein [Haloplanus salilacus]|uniref:hypothetical protein n=1 Tax=Haloplanus salilacus TaxID=2949994 RepID=UPI0030D29A6C